MNYYEALENIFRRFFALEDVVNLIRWDTYSSLNHNCINEQIKQLATIEGIKYSIIADPWVGDLLQEVEQSNLSEAKSHNVENMRSIYQSNRSIPIDMVEAFSSCSCKTMISWLKAREENKFSIVANDLAAMVKIVRDMATIRAESVGCPRYDALLGQDSGMDSSQMDSLFVDLGSFLRRFIPEVVELQKKQKVIRFKNKFSFSKQKEIVSSCAKIFELSQSRLRAEESSLDFIFPLQSSLNLGLDEAAGSKVFRVLRLFLNGTGKLLYNSNGYRSKLRSSNFKDVSSSIYESYGMFLSHYVGSSRSFVKMITPVLRKAVAGRGAVWSEDNIYNLINLTEPGTTMNDADSLTYPVHLMLNYTLEKALIDDSLKAKDLPSAWEEDMQYYLNITPKSDNEGCLQNIHWYSGSFGVFPTMLLGYVIAGQTFEKFSYSKDVLNSLAEGKVADMLKWIKMNLYRNGSKNSIDSFAHRITGKRFGLQSYKKLCNKTYLPDGAPPELNSSEPTGKKRASKGREYAAISEDNQYARAKEGAVQDEERASYDSHEGPAEGSSEIG